MVNISKFGTLGLWRYTCSKLYLGTRLISLRSRESFPYSRVISPPMPMAGPSPCSRGLDGHYSPLQYPENHDEQLKANSNQAPGYCPSSASMKMNIARETRDFREEMRKKANNARERMRVKSMNIEFKKLEQLSRNHVSMEKQPTRLQILRSTKDTILALEAKLRVQFEMEKELRETSPTQKVPIMIRMRRILIRHHRHDERTPIAIMDKT
ncbi:Oidioi.mRNA.OKI2018_I69.XSR.g15341.t1.cds [Oikopleura dioica]|uniref:Oidioi.mRNA.OKI2018_I69.XSR.g15341.t1.cds n=1 Tax=Oikopleura dioica TaxID=34765 RepID=A0ABN7SD46_OIKDI|nr:Oidioi.mRNA.OKI2018_I69.XSR.g15341.t1.cds [Oikopleura dioica]